MDYCVTSKPWAIFNEDEKTHNNNKYPFWNHLKFFFPIPKTPPRYQTIYPIQ